MMVRPVIDIAPVFATLGGIPPAVAGAISEAHFDLLDHHRRSVIKHAQAAFPGRRSAAKYIATRLFRYGRKKANIEFIEDAQGESFGVSRPDLFGDDNLENLEEGPQISASDYMAVPIAAGLQQRAWGTTKSGVFGKLQKDGKLQIVYRKGKPALLVAEHEARRGRNAVGERTAVYAVLIKQRHQRALLAFYPTFDSIVPRHADKYDRVIELALTEAGRQKLATDNTARNAGREAFAIARAEALAKGLSSSDARKVAADASREARKAVRSAGGGS